MAIPARKTMYFIIEKLNLQKFLHTALVDDGTIVKCGSGRSTFYIRSDAQ